MCQSSASVIMGTPRVQGLNFRVSVSPYLSSSKGSPDVSFYAGVRRPGMQVTPEDFPQWCVAPTWCGLCCPLLAVLAPTRTSAVPVPANPSREPTVNGEERPNAEVRHRAWISAEPTQCSVIRLSGSPPRADGARRRSTRGSDRRSRKVRRIPRCQTGSRALAAGVDCPAKPCGRKRASIRAARNMSRLRPRHGPPPGPSRSGTPAGASGPPAPQA